MIIVITIENTTKDLIYEDILWIRTKNNGISLVGMVQYKNLANLDILKIIINEY